LPRLQRLGQRVGGHTIGAITALRPRRREFGHIRTRDFRTFEANPHNPVFIPSDDPEAWDADGVLTPQVVLIDGRYSMVDAGKKGNEWQTGG
jgi:hypothetical protein